MPKKYPPEFKCELVTVAPYGDLIIAEVALDLGVDRASARRWMKQANLDGGIKDGQTSSEQPEAVSLGGRMRRLEMENKILNRVAGTLREGTVLRR